MKTVALSKCLLLTILLSASLAWAHNVWATSPVWPPPPAAPRVEYVRQISLHDIKPHSGFFGKIGRFLGGSTPDEKLNLPFNLLLSEDTIYLTCQNRSELVVIKQSQESFQVFNCEDQPLVNPLGLAQLDGVVYLSDSGNGTVYRFTDNKLEPWLVAGLVRPTGLVALADENLILVVDTGDHRLKFFDLAGNLVRTAGQRGDKTTELNFPTFATRAGQDILVNDTLNYQVKRYSSTGQLLSAYGEEGDGPGTFARPKGVAVDSEGNAWVVDALFDNVQVFDGEGRLLLVIGGPGQTAGEFWSPAGIATRGREIYIADTFNNRIQVLRYIGGDQ